MFELHPRLAQDAFELGDFPLCRLLLMNDSTYPWFVMVPMREQLREIYHLNEEDRYQLIYESCLLSGVLDEVFQADKLNVAALGNMVPQLHIHHIVRYTTDPAWPHPIWGKAAADHYQTRALYELREQVIPALGDEFSALP